MENGEISNLKKYSPIFHSILQSRHQTRFIIHIKPPQGIMKGNITIAGQQNRNIETIAS